MILKNTYIILLVTLITFVSLGQEDYLYAQKRNPPTVEQTIILRVNQPQQSNLELYKPLNLWTNPLFRYNNFRFNQDYYLQQYNWKYNTYYHVNNPWLNNHNRFSPQFIYNRPNGYYTPRRRTTNNTNRYNQPKNNKPSNTYKNSKKGQLNGTFNQEYHQHQPTKGNSTRLKKKY